MIDVDKLCFEIYVAHTLTRILIWHEYGHGNT